MKAFHVWRVPCNIKYCWGLSAEWQLVSQHDYRFEAVAACNPPGEKGFIYAVRPDFDPPPPPRLLTEEESY